MNERDDGDLPRDDDRLPDDDDDDDKTFTPPGGGGRSWDDRIKKHPALVACTTRTSQRMRGKLAMVLVSTSCMLAPAQPVLGRH